MTSMDMILFYFNMLLAVFIVVGSFLYFIKTKTKYRWIKLFWGLEMMAYLAIYMFILFGGNISRTTMFLTASLPLTALVYGLVSAFSRVKESELLNQLIDELNGQTEEWVRQKIEELRDGK
jgi:hypothetical protein